MPTPIAGKLEPPGAAAVSARRFNGVKVFSSTLFAERQYLGERVTAWLALHTDLIVRDVVTTQSSDSRFHCLTITVFYWKS